MDFKTEHDGYEINPDRWDAQTLMGSYYEIAVDLNGYLVSHDYVHLSQPYDTLDEAKAAAQADYEARILSAIVS